MKISLSYLERQSFYSNPMAQQLLRLMEEKKTNLAFSADIADSNELIRLINLLGSEICILKTHIDIVQDFSQELIHTLKYLAKKHQFLIFEDRKFADIGQTVLHQYQGGMFRISEWSDMVNAHALPGPGTIEALKKIGLPLNKAGLLLAQMSSEQNLCTDMYIQAVIQMASLHRDFIIGLIAQQRLFKTPDFIYMTPGIQLAQFRDEFGQCYKDPYQAVFELGLDVIIVGRAIYNSVDPLKTAQEFRKIGWQAYLDRLK